MIPESPIFSPDVLLKLECAYPRQQKLYAQITLKG